MCTQHMCSEWEPGHSEGLGFLLNSVFMLFFSTSSHRFSACSQCKIQFHIFASSYFSVVLTHFEITLSLQGNHSIVCVRDSCIMGNSRPAECHLSADSLLIHIRNHVNLRSSPQTRELTVCIGNKEINLN